MSEGVSKPCSRMMMPRFIGVKPVKGWFREHEELFSHMNWHLWVLTLTSVKVFGMRWRRFYTVPDPCIVNTRSWPKIYAPLNGNNITTVLSTFNNPQTFTEVRTQECQFICENNSSCSLTTILFLILIKLAIVILEYGHGASPDMVVKKIISYTLHPSL